MNTRLALIAGLAGTAAMTMLMLVAPMMGMPEMPIGEMLGSFLGIGATLGWIMHILIGVTLGFGFAMVFAGRLPGNGIVQGLAYGFLVFLLAQLVVMPMMGAGVFSGGNMPMIMGSLMGHFVYGGVLGYIYRPASESKTDTSFAE